MVSMVEFPQSQSEADWVSDDPGEVMTPKIRRARH